MKSQIVPVLLLCVALPWITSGVFRMEGQRAERENRNGYTPAETLSGSDTKTANETIGHDELSNKRIIYLIP